ncbi:myosin light chain kinase, smooth muscle-like [Paramacrobiotus metropolitanus]|uniref:myosin light chain kinase, smooth muscle-like n=1 Tax=Paramacrobiotus metropolitanus TaxID=2943436 RepID=UPI002445B38E|nr:myosin light chain kinase, smooth muscle-like [Paramacrobiotus metropolitanus]XP_055343198.1 myosin light chain kinase, smooth muscle-like [Paramacrobiotus metropolitanus]XP_055343206.1 myosin light chain kinase, smooth muscle-like [Paramacrobiotus metropolitanus]XP_055343213.1 myosin light chain kinase, smooth muscle-like [Paramacrobiotus metropolitanus]
MSKKIDETESDNEEHQSFEARSITIKTDKKMAQFYEIMEELGRGKFGTVCKCREKATSRILAAKTISVKRPQERKEVENEIEIMRSLQHPRLLQLYDAFDDGGTMVLVMELISGGELFERVIDDEFILTEKVCTIFMRQICEGVSFMHDKSVIHLDMKPENILCVTQNGNRIKLIDFGLARKYDPKTNVKVMFGTPEFVAPEVVNFEPISFATDMWSVGVICYILLSGLSPFMGDNDAETLSNVTQAEWDFEDESFDHISADAKDFITKLLVKDPAKRMTAKQCLEHKWLRRDKPAKTDEKALSKVKLKHFVIRRRWQKAVNAILALHRMGATV